MQALRPTFWLTDFTGCERVELVWAEVQKLRTIIRVYAAREKQWSAELVGLICEEYARFLLVKLALADDMCKLLAVPDGIRWVWERHLLHNSKHYEKFQTLVDGHLGFVEHPVADENARRGITWYVYSLAFGKYPPCEVWQPPASRVVTKHLVPQREKREQDNQGDTPCSSTSLRDEENSNRPCNAVNRTAQKAQRTPKDTSVVNPSISQLDPGVQHGRAHCDSLVESENEPTPVPRRQVEVTRADARAFQPNNQRPPAFPERGPGATRSSGLVKNQRRRIISSVSSSPKSPLSFSKLEAPRLGNVMQQARMASAPPSLNVYQLPSSTTAIQANRMASQRINSPDLDSSLLERRATAANLSLSNQKIPPCDTRLVVGTSNLQNLPMGKFHSSLPLSGRSSPRYSFTPPSPNFDHVPVPEANRQNFSGVEDAAGHNVDVAPIKMVLASPKIPHGPDPESAILDRAVHVTPYASVSFDTRTEDVPASEKSPHATNEARVQFPSSGRRERQRLNGDCSMNPPTTPVTPLHPKIPRSADRKPELTGSKIRQPPPTTVENSTLKSHIEPRRIQWLHEEAHRDDSSVECVTPLQSKPNMAKVSMRTGMHTAMREPKHQVRPEAKSTARGVGQISLRSSKVTPLKRLNSACNKWAPTEVQKRARPMGSNQVCIDVDCVDIKQKRNDDFRSSVSVQRKSGSQMHVHNYTSLEGGKYGEVSHTPKRERSNSRPKVSNQMAIVVDSMDSMEEKDDKPWSFVQRQSGSQNRVDADLSRKEGKLGGKSQVPKRARSNSAAKNVNKRTIGVESVDTGPKKQGQARSSLFAQRQSENHKGVLPSTSQVEANYGGKAVGETTQYTDNNKTDSKTDAGWRGSSSQSPKSRTTVPPRLKVAEIEKEGRVRIWLRQSKKPGLSQCAGRPSGKPWIGMDGIKTRYSLSELATKLRAVLGRALVGQKREVYAEPNISRWMLLYCGRDGEERAIEGDGVFFRQVLLREGYMHSKLPTLNIVVVTGPKKPT